jgi:hypothetical protein
MNSTKIRLTVLVAALGYFVDIYDLQLFNVVSKTIRLSALFMADGRHACRRTAVGNYGR